MVGGALDTLQIQEKSSNLLADGSASGTEAIVYREDARLPEAAVGGRVEEAFGFRQDYFTQVRQTGFCFVREIASLTTRFLHLSFLTDGRTNGRTDGLMDGWTDGRTDGRPDRQMGKASYRDAWTHLKKPQIIKYPPLK